MITQSVPATVAISSDNLPFPLEERYYRYSRYLYKTFGKRVQKISLSAGFTCPNRDGSKGTGGCIYCNNAAFLPPDLDPRQSLSAQIQTAMPHLQQRYGVDSFIGYLQAYTNTYASIDYLRQCYSEIIAHPNIVALNIGTRADCLSEPVLDLLVEFATQVPLTVEIGIESIHDPTLKWMNRGHAFAEVEQAVAALKNRGLRVTGHIILGLPVETREQMVATALAANKLGLNGLKIHHLYIVKGTELGRRYRQSPFPLLSLTEYLELVVDILECLNPTIVIERLLGHTPPQLLIAPHWGVGAPWFQQQVQKALEQRDSWQGKFYKND